jgi:hypothetical protein
MLLLLYPLQKFWVQKLSIFFKRVWDGFSVVVFNRRLSLVPLVVFKPMVWLGLTCSSPGLLCCCAPTVLLKKEPMEMGYLNATLQHICEHSILCWGDFQQVPTEMGCLNNTLQPRYAHSIQWLYLSTIALNISRADACTQWLHAYLVHESCWSAWREINSSKNFAV